MYAVSVPFLPPCFRYDGGEERGGEGGVSEKKKVLQWIQAWKEGQCITYQRKRIIRREVEREEGSWRRS